MKGRMKYMDIIIRHRILKEITLLEFFGNDNIPNKPMIITYHGLTGSKEEKLLMAYKLAQKGFYVVSPDAYEHGERKKQEGIDFNRFFEIIANTTDEIDQIINCFSDNECVDISRIGLTGTSMGGCITFNYLARPNRRIKAAVSVVSTPDWSSIITALDLLSQRIDKQHIKEIIGDKITKLKDTALSIQPLNNPGSLCGIPILLLNGETDEIIPIDNVRGFYNILSSIPGNEDNIKLITYPNVGHAETLIMIDEAVNWFKSYL